MTPEQYRERRAELVNLRERQLYRVFSVAADVEDAMEFRAKAKWAEDQIAALDAAYKEQTDATD